jgi:hypothetical protein
MADIPRLKQVARGSSEATLNFIKKPNQTVLSLENESQKLKTEESRTLEANVGNTFTLFPRLPSELRR